MWKTLSDWRLALLNMTRELEENRVHKNLTGHSGITAQLISAQALRKL